MNLSEHVRVIENFPKPGIVFRDITTLLKNGPAFKESIDLIKDQFSGKNIDVVVGPESRGFIFGTPVAYAMGVGFAPVRKPGKLPAEFITEEYALEYGTDKLQMHVDGITPGQRVLIVDDLLATGGTINAVVRMIHKLGGIVVGMAFVIELEELNGRSKIDKNVEIYSLLKY